MPPKVFRGERLRHLREKRSLTLQALSELAGIGINQLHRYETGQTDPSPYQIKRLAATFGASADYLLGLTDAPQKQTTEATLSTDEQRFLQALREGRLNTLLVMLGQTLPDEQQQPNIAGRHITPHR